MNQRLGNARLLFETVLAEGTFVRPPSYMNRHVSLLLRTDKSVALFS